MSGVIRILNVMEPPAERRLLDTLAENDPPLFHDIRLAMFGADVAECEEWPLAEAAG
jgi:flagellar motor switch protein FliG